MESDKYLSIKELTDMIREDGYKKAHDNLLERYRQMEDEWDGIEEVGEDLADRGFGE